LAFDRSQVWRRHAIQWRSDNAASETGSPNQTGTPVTYSKRALQLAITGAGLVPVGAGLAGVLLGPPMVSATGGSSIQLDSHYRYLSGLLLGIGLGFWTTVPHIEREGRKFRLLATIVVVGGLGRLWSLQAVGVPGRAMLFGLIMELAVTPLLAFWQYQVAKGVS
jgi:hypothetical protein